MVEVIYVSHLNGAIYKAHLKTGGCLRSSIASLIYLGYLLLIHNHDLDVLSSNLGFKRLLRLGQRVY